MPTKTIIILLTSLAVTAVGIAFYGVSLNSKDSSQVNTPITEEVLEVDIKEEGDRKNEELIVKQQLSLQESLEIADIIDNPNVFFTLPPFASPANIKEVEISVVKIAKYYPIEWPIEHRIHVPGCKENLCSDGLFADNIEDENAVVVIDLNFKNTSDNRPASINIINQFRFRIGQSLFAPEKRFTNPQGVFVINPLATVRQSVTVKISKTINELDLIYGKTSASLDDGFRINFEDQTAEVIKGQ